jgi:hypothetical protein
VENCDFHIRGGTRHFGWVLKPFDASQQCVYVNNRFYCDHAHDNTFGIFGTIGRATNRDLNFSGNMVQVSFGQEPEGDNGRHTSFAAPGGRGLIDCGVAEQRLTVCDNHIQARFAGPALAAVIRVAGARQFRVAGNQIDVEAAAARPDGIVLADSQTGLAAGNVISGECRAGVRRSGALENVETVSNVADASVETALLEDDEQSPS